jgi:hypothetical protein
MDAACSTDCSSSGRPSATRPAAIPGDPIEVALPQLDNLALDDLGGLLEGDAITLLEGRGGHSLAFLVRSGPASGAEEQ